MQYNKTIWTNTPDSEITAEKLNNMEDGIELATEKVETVENVVNGIALEITTISFEKKLPANSYATPYSYWEQASVPTEYSQYGELVNVCAANKAAVPVPVCLSSNRTRYAIASTQAENDVYMTFAKLKKGGNN